MKKEYIFLIVGILIASIVVVSFILFSTPSSRLVPTPQASSYSVERYPIVSIKPDYAPRKMQDLTYIPQNQGGGIDVSSNAVKESTIEINKLANSLPFNQKLSLSNGETVEVLIPAKDLQLNAWTLTVQIFDIDYQSPSESSDYAIVKSSFIEASNKIFDWMETKGVNPDKLIISWGDREFIQNRAEEWLTL